MPTSIARYYPVFFNHSVPENNVHSWMRKSPVTVLVGANKTKYFLPKELLVEKVPFFKAALTNSSYEECKTNTVELPAENSLAFDLFVDWLFLAKLTPIQRTERHYNIPFETVISEKMLDDEMPWHHLLCMASKFCCAGLEKDALEEIQEFHEETRTVCHPKLLKHDFVNSPPAKGLTDYILLEFSRLESGPPQDFETMVDFMTKRCPDLLVEGIKQLQQRNAGRFVSLSVNGFQFDGW